MTLHPTTNCQLDSSRVHTPYSSRYTMRTQSLQPYKPPPTVNFTQVPGGSKELNMAVPS